MNFDQRVRADADAISRHESLLDRTLNDRRRLAKVLKDASNEQFTFMIDALAGIGVTAQTDQAEAGRQYAALVRQFAHESCRWELGDDAEVVEQRPDLTTLDLMTMAARGIPAARKP